MKNKYNIKIGNKVAIHWECELITLCEVTDTPFKKNTCCEDIEFYIKEISHIEDGNKTGCGFSATENSCDECMQSNLQYTAQYTQIVYIDSHGRKVLIERSQRERMEVL